MPRRCARCGRSSRRDGGFDLAGTPHWARVRRRASCPGAARMPTASPRSATCTRATASSSTRTRPTASRSGASTAIRRCRSSASRRRCPSKFAATIREALGREPDASGRYAGLEARPQRCAALPADAERVKAFIAEHAAGRLTRRPRTPWDTRSHAFAAQPARRAAPRVLPAGRPARVPHRPRAAPAAVRAVGADRRRRRLVPRGAAARTLARWARVPSSMRRGLLLLAAALIAICQPAAAAGARAAGDRARGAAAGAGAALPAVRRRSARSPAGQRWPRVRVRDRLLDRHRADPVAWRSRSRRRRPFVWLRAIGGGLLLASPIWFGNALIAERAVVAGASDDAPAPEAGINAGSEAVLAAQAFLLDNALDRPRGRAAGRRPISTSSASRRMAAAMSYPQGRRGRAEGDGHALGHRRPLDGAGQQSADAAHRAVRHRHQPARDAERDRRDHRSRGRRRDDLPREPRQRATTGSSAEQPPLSLVELTPAGLEAAARRRRHQVADHRRVRVLLRRLHPRRCRTTTR